MSDQGATRPSAQSLQVTFRETYICCQTAMVPLAAEDNAVLTTEKSVFRRLGFLTPHQKNGAVALRASGAQARNLVHRSIIVRSLARSVCKVKKAVPPPPTWPPDGEPLTGLASERILRASPDGVNTIDIFPVNRASRRTHPNPKNVNSVVNQQTSRLNGVFWVSMPDDMFHRIAAELDVPLHEHNGRTEVTSSQPSETTQAAAR
jgi:hypothetical protein